MEIEDGQEVHILIKDLDHWTFGLATTTRKFFAQSPQLGQAHR